MNQSETIKTINFLKYKYYYLVISALFLVPGIISLLLNGLKLSIDFTGGTVGKYKLEKTASKEEIATMLKDIGIEEKGLEIEENTVSIRSQKLSAEQNVFLKEKLASATGGLVEELNFQSIGPVLGQELARKGVIALVITMLSIVLYIALSFRNIPKPYSAWKFGISAVIALIHDVLILVGAFSLLGKFAQVEVDTLFLTAALTIMGFSVHDTIVVFDRIRENLNKHVSKSFTEVANISLTETIRRSINTSVTVILVLLSILFFGGESTRNFTAALLIGVISGTYSSIFNATPILAIWESRKKH